MLQALVFVFLVTGTFGKPSAKEDSYLIGGDVEHVVTEENWNIGGGIVETDVTEKKWTFGGGIVETDVTKDIWTFGDNTKTDVTESTTAGTTDGTVVTDLTPDTSADSVCVKEECFNSIAKERCAGQILRAYFYTRCIVTENPFQIGEASTSKICYDYFIDPECQSCICSEQACQTCICSNRRIPSPKNCVNSTTPPHSTTTTPTTTTPKTTTTAPSTPPTTTTTTPPTPTTTNKCDDPNKWECCDEPKRINCSTTLTEVRLYCNTSRPSARPYCETYWLCRLEQSHCTGCLYDSSACHSAKCISAEEDARNTCATNADKADCIFGYLYNRIEMRPCMPCVNVVEGGSEDIPTVYPWRTIQHFLKEGNQSNMLNDDDVDNKTGAEDGSASKNDGILLTGDLELSTHADTNDYGFKAH